jgi:hypothetical protein
MKHLKFFEGFNDSYYEEIRSVDFFRVKNFPLSENELDEITSIVNQKGGWIQRHRTDLMITIHIPRLKGTVTFDEHTNVKKSDDEFYYIAYDIMNQKKFYKADQLDGLKKLLDDIL